MSSYWTGYAITGLVLSSAEFNAMLEVYKKKNPEWKNIEEVMEDYGIDCTRFIMSQYAGESMPGLQDDTDGRYDEKFTYFDELSNDNVDGATFWPFYKPDGSMNLNQMTEDGKWESALQSHPIWDSEADVCYVIESDEDMCSPQAFESKPYNSYQDFVQEFKNKIGGYLPEDFDWDAHLGYLAYAAYA